MKPDDHLQDEQQLQRVRAEAHRALTTANALGRLPTPIDEIIEAAQLSVLESQDIDAGFLARSRRRVTGALKRALSKVLGVLDVTARVMHIDKSVHAAKLPFLKLHELAHGWIPWQCSMYAYTEDSESHLDPDISELFERQANAFATEVMFQLDAFTVEAADHPFAIGTPLKLARTYGGSLYATIRRYVSTNHRACAVVVLDPPTLQPGAGFVAAVRRVISSPCFAKQFGTISLPESVTPDDPIGKMVPIGEKQRMSGPRLIVLTDRNGIQRECIAEAFKYKYHVFVLVCPQAALTKKVVLVSP